MKPEDYERVPTHQPPNRITSSPLNRYIHWATGGGSYAGNDTVTRIRVALKQARPFTYRMGSGDIDIGVILRILEQEEAR